MRGPEPDMVRGVKGWWAWVTALLLPWPTRAERRAAVEAARTEAQQATARAQKARQLEADLRAVLADNHIARAIYDGLTGNYERGDLG